MANIWEGMYQKDPWAKKRIETGVRMLYPYLKSGDLVTDLGCFTQQARAYLPLDVEYLGVDSETYREGTSIADLAGVTEVKSTHILLFEVLEHLVDPDRLLQALHFEGCLVVSLPNEATLFHRLRCLFGTVDAECFSGQYKHLHLPSLQQARNLLLRRFDILDEKYYISPSAHNSRSAWVSRILEKIPVQVQYGLSSLFPSLFARGWIFICNKPTQPKNNPPSKPIEHTP